MNRETQRQINRLRVLAELVLTSPEYDQTMPNRCVIGLGNRLKNRKIAKFSWPTFWRGQSDFSKKFGVSVRATDAMYDGDFKKINRRAKNWDIINTPYNFNGKSSNLRRSAAAILNYIADQKEQGKTV